ncbi:MAG: methionine adenosyltransferase domain-containing protein, partial [Paracoccus sp. (in: a-proteobacteria)]|nr:methionine adenosyltransferase domain-containing protein [Paracoccus sp. (in: a-proteobacteria)]
GLAKRCEIQVSYAIGEAQPTSISLNSFGTGSVTDDRIVKVVREVFDLRPFAIIRDLDLLHPIYRPTATYGHFGRAPYALNGATAFSWERTDRAESLRAALS